MIDAYITVDSAEHPAFRRPNRVAEALSERFEEPVRSVMVLDSSTGLTASARYENEGTDAS